MLTNFSCTCIKIYLSVQSKHCYLTEKIFPIYFAGDKDRYSFPAELSTIHAEFTYFYFPGDFVFPRKSTRWRHHPNRRHTKTIDINESYHSQCRHRRSTFTWTQYKSISTWIVCYGCIHLRWVCTKAFFTPPSHRMHPSNQRPMSLASCIWTSKWRP